MFFCHQVCRRCNVELSVISRTEEKKLEAAHHKFQIRFLRITWKQSQECRNLETDRVIEVEDMITERRLRWLGHVLRMQETRIPYPATCLDFIDT